MKIERWGWYSVAVNIALVAINAGLAAASGSLAVEAEMIHNLVALLTAIGVLIGLRLLTRKSKSFPLRSVQTGERGHRGAGRDDFFHRL